MRCYVCCEQKRGETVLTYRGVSICRVCSAMVASAYNGIDAARKYAGNTPEQIIKDRLHA